MRPTRRKAAAVAAAAVARSSSPSSISSVEEDEMMDSSDLEEMDTGDNEIFTEEEDIEEEESLNRSRVHDVLDNNDGMELLSEQEEDEEDEIEDEVEEEEVEDEEEEEDDEEEIAVHKPASRNNKRKKPVIEEVSDEEAIFSDDAEIVENRPMTKRQRAKIYQEIPEEYLELPTVSSKKKLLTEEEEQLKKSEVARRRKNQSIQRAEKDKADTINRLLKKQASKSKRIIDDAEEKATGNDKAQRLDGQNSLRYVNTSKGSQLGIPSKYTVEQVFGIATEKSTESAKIKHCEAKGCSNNRKYTAKKSGKAVCSLDHYKVVEAI